MPPSGAANSSDELTTCCALLSGKLATRLHAPHARSIRLTDMIRANMPARRFLVGALAFILCYAVAPVISRPSLSRVASARGMTATNFPL
jgi:hypothetical protein